MLEVGEDTKMPQIWSLPEGCYNLFWSVKRKLERKQKAQTANLFDSLLRSLSCTWLQAKEIIFLNPAAELCSGNSWPVCHGLCWQCRLTDDIVYGAQNARTRGGWVCCDWTILLLWGLVGRPSYNHLWGDIYSDRNLEIWVTWYSLPPKDEIPSMVTTLSRKLWVLELHGPCLSPSSITY